jgi:hypothetical protein
LRRKIYWKIQKKKLTGRYIRKGYWKIQKKRVTGRYRRKWLLEDTE